MNELSIKPIDDKIYVLPHPSVEKTLSGLYIPDTAQEKPLVGTVVAKGDGIYAINTGELIPMKTKIGDTVTYPSHAGYDVSYDGVEYKIMKEGEIFAIVS